MSPRLVGRHALITGGSRGLGLSMARKLARAGASVSITAARSIAQLEAAHAELAAIADGRVFSSCSDIGDAEACARIAAEAAERLGPVDILVNNAARGPREQPLTRDRGEGIDPWSLDPDVYSSLLSTNVAGAWFMARATVPAMVERGFGRVVNISTSRPTMVMALGGSYGPSKAALEAQSLAWARHLAGSGVTVNVLLPGGQTDTDFIAGGKPGKRKLHPWPDGAGSIAEGRLATLLPATVLDAPILWLASEDSADCTGARFVGANWPPHLPERQAAAMAAGPTLEGEIWTD